MQNTGCGGNSWACSVRIWDLRAKTWQDPVPNPGFCSSCEALQGLGWAMGVYVEQEDSTCVAVGQVGGWGGGAARGLQGDPAQSR